MRRSFPRSAIKPVQALALVESGAADAFNLDDAEVALACASHHGEARHVEKVAAWLPRLDLTVADLECGAHLPYDQEAMAALLRRGEAPTALHNNCSGKHSGFLTLARHQGWPCRGYIQMTHSVQQRVLGVLEGMTGLDLTSAPWGVDGCGIPTLAVPLGNLALAMARLSDPADQPERRQAACQRVRQAMTNEPWMVGGSESFCSQVMDATKGRALVKTGAEGVYCGSFPELGLGVALKAADGAGRAAEVAMGHLLQRLEVLTPAETEALGGQLHPCLTNRAGTLVGEIRVSGA